MITHVIVELKQPVKEEHFHMDTVLPSEYYGYGTPLILCKECEYHDEGRCENWEYYKTEDDYFCADGKRKEE